MHEKISWYLQWLGIGITIFGFGWLFGIAAAEWYWLTTFEPQEIPQSFSSLGATGPAMLGVLVYFAGNRLEAAVDEGRKKGRKEAEEENLP